MLAETTIRDIRIGARVLVKEKTFSLLAIIVLALGISAVAAQFSVVNGILLRGFSFPNAERLMSVNLIDPTTATPFGVEGRVLSADFEELLPGQKSFDLLASYLNGSTVNMTAGGQPRRYTGVYTTEAFFRILGVSPALGRDFTPADNKPGAEKVAIISHGAWQRDFGGAPTIIGRTVQINGKPATIIGVMPHDFAFPQDEDLWLPIYGDFPVRARTDPQASAPGVMGLIKSGVTLAQAQAEFTTIAKRLAAAYPESNKRFNAARVEPLINTFTGPQLRGTLWTMLAFCVGVLLIACVNVMNMQFARATLRAKELAVRSSLGATRSRLIRQMLTESLVLAACGAVLGILLAYLAVDWLDATLRAWESPPPPWMTFDLDAPVLLVAVEATIVAAVGSGLLPAWMSSRASAAAVLRDGGRGTTGRFAGLVTRGLVVVQIVVTCVLLIGSLLQVRSLVKQQTIDYGYDTTAVMTARMGLMDGAYPTTAERKAFYDRLQRQLSGSGQFAAVALSSRLRMAFGGSGPIEIEGKVYKATRDRTNANFEQVTSGYFEAVGRKLLAGRTFNEDDLDSKLPVAIVNATFARKHFGAESPIGRRFRTGDGTGPYGPWRTVVGVSPTLRMTGPFNNPNVDESGFYVPFYSNPFGPAEPEPLAGKFATIIVTPHGTQRPEALLDPLRREVRTVDPDLPLYFAGTPASNLDTFLAGSRIVATMFTAFGVVAVVLAAVGIYGVVSFAVSQRTQEFGVRMALGADRTRILSMVLRQGSRQVALGLVVGIGLSLLLATLGRDGISQILFGVTPFDPVTYFSVSGLVVLVSLVAVLVPARRATRVDPIIALRAE